MRGALASHMNLRRMQRQWQPLFDWDFTQQSPGALVLPTGLVFARASSGHTVQTGTNGLIVGGAIASNDVGRIGRLADAHSYGIFVEPARTNLAHRSREIATSPWLTGSTVATTADAAAGPDGASSADRSNVTSGGFSNYQPITTVNGTTYAFSTWIAARSSAQNHRVAFSETVSAYTLVSTSNAPTTWQRVSGTRAATATTCYLVPCDGSNRTGTGGPAAMALDFFTDFAQVEAGKYPTSAIITTGSTATRAAERLTIDSTRATASIVGGRLAIYLRFRATAALSALDYLSEGQLFESSDHEVGAWIPSNSRQIIVYANGSQSITASSAIALNAVDLIEFYFELGAGKTLCKWRVNNGAWNTAVWSVRDDSFAALSFTGGIDIMNSGGVWQMPGVLERLTTLTPGHF